MWGTAALQRREHPTVKTIEHWIGGKPTRGASTRTGPVWNPATGEQQAEVLLAAKEDVAAAVRVASDAFAEWSQASMSKRTKALFAFRELVNAHIDEIAEAITDEHGKVLSDARGEVQRGLEVVEFACGIAHLLKPSERDPSASLVVARLWQEAGLPDGVFNVVHGDKEAVDAILDHPGVAAVSFVGSTAIARYIHQRAGANGKRVQALGGAKNHAIVLPDADVDFASDHLVAAAFGSAGERCMAISA